MVEVALGSTSSKGRPLGMVWMVWMRRGKASVMAAVGLGRSAADRLAHRLTEFLGSTAPVGYDVDEL